MSTINVIAPLSPAGEFPIADANNISLDLVEGKNAGQTNVAVAMNRMAQSLEDLETEVGMFEHSDGEGNTVPSSSLSGKINKVSENVESLVDHIANVKKDIAVCLGYMDRDDTQIDLGKTSVYTLLTSTNDALDALIRNIGSPTAEGEASIRTQIKDLFDKLTDLEQLIGTEYVQDGVTKYEGLYSRIQILQTYILALDDSYDSFLTDVGELIADLNEDVNKLDGKILNIENVSSSINKIESAVASLRTTVDSNGNALGLGAGETIKSVLTALRDHMNTMIPPTLRVSRDGSSVYDKDSTPTINITASVNRPLEEPLAIYINGEKKLDSTAITRSCSATWAPTCSSVDNLPKVSTIAVTIAHKNDPDIIYTTQTLSCTFAEEVYWGVSDAESMTDEGFGNLLGGGNSLCAGHPTTVTFTVTGADPKYCYYLYPATYDQTYDQPTISVGGFAGGFRKCTNNITLNNISYNIYRSNQKLNSTTITIK